MIVFYIPGPLREFTSGASTVRLEDRVANVGEALERLGRRYPGVRDRVLDERGFVREHVNVFVGSDSIRELGGLATAVRPGVEISILSAVSGG